MTSFIICMRNKILKRMIESRRMLGHVECMGERWEVYTELWSGTPEEKR
jgi:hypothetical protein